MDPITQAISWGRGASAGTDPRRWRVAHLEVGHLNLCLRTFVDGSHVMSRRESYRLQPDNVRNKQCKTWEWHHHGLKLAIRVRINWGKGWFRVVHIMSLFLGLNRLTMNKLWVQSWSSWAKEHSCQQICPHSRMALSSSPSDIIDNQQDLCCSTNIASMISCPGTCTKSMAPQPRHMARHDETQVWQLLAMKSFPFNAHGSLQYEGSNSNMLLDYAVWQYTLVIQYI